MKLGEPLLRLDTTDSTNRVALEWNEAPHGACVVARAQTGGRGRLGRSWSSPRDKGLYLSLILRPQDPAKLAAYSLFAALRIAIWLERLVSLPMRVKWPNDLIVLSKAGEPCKVGGILCETRGNVLVVGIGINFNQTPDELPQRPIFPATSLFIESGQTFEIESVLNSLLVDLNGEVSRLKMAINWGSFARDFENRCYGFGEIVRVKTASDLLVGVFAGLGEDGTMLLRTSDGLISVVAGDVSYF